MNKIELLYGTKTLDLAYDPDLWQPLLPTIDDLMPLTKEDILVALANPYDGQSLEEIIDVGEQVVIVVSDATRATGSEQIVPLLIARLMECGLKLNDISILFATGIHRQLTEVEQRRLITDAVYEAVMHYDHDAYDTDNFVDMGETAYGTQVLLNKRLLAADHVILTGSIGFHYFAGFSGGRKSILPGLAAASSIEQNHLLSLDLNESTTIKRRAGVGTGRLDGNAVHEDMREACAMLAPSFLINTILNSDQEIVQVFCGEWYDAHRRGCAEYVERHKVEIAEKRDLVIAACGGAPKDLNLIQAHKALDLAVGALKDGGDIILIAQCADGLGRGDFLQWFQSGSAQAIAQRLKEEYKVNGQTAWSLASKIERFNVTLVSQLPAEQVRQMGMRPAQALDDALKGLEDRSGYIIPFATETIPIISRQ